MFSDAFKPAVARSVFGDTRGSLIPSILWLSFNNTLDVELSGRIEVANTDDMWLPTATGVTNNTPIVGFADAAWIIGSISLWTAQIDGELIATIRLDAPLTVESGADLTFDAGALRVDVA